MMIGSWQKLSKTIRVKQNLNYEVENEKLKNDIQHEVRKKNK